ncbi:AMP-binding protein, partial [Dehalococcoidia bacterium]|nr:AMP-binding protein [Dehalococcoidia bacterium]
MSSIDHNMKDYDQTKAEFELEVPEYFNFSRDVFDKWAANSEKVAMLWTDDQGNERKISYAEFSERSKKLSKLFDKNGLKKGDTVIVILPRVVEWWETFLACLRSG